MIMLFLSVIFALLYLLLEQTLMARSYEDIARDAAIVAEEVELEEDIVVLDLDDDEEESLTGNILYTIYSIDRQWIAGRDSAWINDIIASDDIQKHRYNGENWLVYDKKAYDDSKWIGWVRVLLPLDTVEATLEQLVFAAMAGAPICLLLAVIGGLFIAGRALGPVHDITQTAEQMGAGELSIRIPYTGTNDEVGKLGKAFNEMANNLEAAFAREKQFTTDASHEMRTPLAVIISYAEDALKRGDIDSYTAAMAIILDKSKQMQTMLGQLLSLARGYEQKELLHIEQLELTAVIEDITDGMREQAQSRNMEIKLKLQPELMIAADLLTITRMLMNLLDNAIKYGKDGGQIEICTSIEAQNLAITIYNDGEGIAEADRPHIFERFYRGDKSRTGSTGVGLGLSFVQMAVQLHGGSISIEDTDSGCCFKILLPSG
jgi:signal transduction histidine kinase